jgi:transposase
MPAIEESTRIKVIELGKAKASQKAISETLKMSRCAVQNIIKKYQLFGTIKNLPKSGPPVKTSRRERLNLVIMSKCHPKWTPRRLRNEWQTSTLVSLRTVRRILNKNGLYGHVAAFKPKVTKTQRRKRLIFCRKYSSWDTEMWKKVVFSDEAQIQMKSSVRTFVRRPSGSNRFLKRYTINGKIWGWFADGLGCY